MGYKHELETVLETGDLLFRQKGYTKTGTDEILSESGFPRSSFYHHFKNKENFALETISYYGERHTSFIEAMLQSDTDLAPLEQLRFFFYKLVEFYCSEDFATACLIQRFAMDESAEQGPIQEEASKQYLAASNLVSECLEKAKSLGQLKDGIVPEETAHYLFSICYGYFNIARLTRDKAQYHRMIAFAFDSISA